jgi:hypothetical protein
VLLRTWRDNCQSKISEKSGGEKYVGPTCGFVTFPEVGPEPLSIPYRPGTPAYRLESKTRKMYCHMPYNIRSCLPAREASDVATCPAAPDPTSLLGRLRRCHVSCGSESFLPTQEGSGAAICPVALDPASLLGRAPALPCVSRHRTRLPAR